MFYNISNSYTRTYWYAWRDLSLVDIPEHICNSCGRKTVSFVHRSDGHCIVVEGGKRFPDMHQYIGCGESFPIFSERAVTVFAEHGISGLQIQEKVALYTQETEDSFIPLTDVPTYYKVKFGGSIDFDYSKMFLKRKRVCSACGKYDLNRQRLYPVFLDNKLWDGSDLCSLTTLPNSLYCTDTVVQLVKKHKLKGFDFHPVHST